MEKVWYKNYDPGVPHDIELPPKTLPRFLEEAAQQYPRNIAVQFMSGRLTFKELNEEVDSFARVLAALGLEPGTPVALHMPNCPQYVIAFYGTLRAGCIVTPCNPLYVERELVHQLNDSGAQAIVTLSRFYPMVRKIKDKTKLKAVIVTNIKDYLGAPLKLLYTLLKEKKEGDRVKLDPGDYWLRDLLKRHRRHPLPQVEESLDKPACYMYTGGTTGVPKGAVLSHGNILANALQAKAWLSKYDEGKEIMLGVLPFFHSYGMSISMNLALVTKAKLITVPRFQIGEILKLIHKERPTLFPGVPSMYVAINNAPDVHKYDLSSIKVCISGAAPLPVEVQKQFEKITNGGRLREGYGLTETSPVTHCNPIFGENRPGSIGLPFPGTVAKIVDLDDPSKEMPIGERGQLAIKGPQVMQGYLNREDETAAIFHDGFILTGDIAMMDEDGYFYIVDRKKDMVIAGGYNIFPREIEEVLYAHEKIKEVCVAGVPHSYRGETIKAYIVLKDGVTMTEEEVIEYCKANLARYKVPTLVEFRKELPKTMVGKILRRMLVEEELAKLKKEQSS
ncbi:MAG: long-chain fatty acid--CoA ligase [Firmicutes bacterium]|nr:long-chain fatty acid--CoA ligase [Bacillota bacterium]HPU00822.1 long-chain fatty acid--CoA ligase [Bacillota bacterium]